jgi:hypothetical protein
VTKIIGLEGISGSELNSQLQSGGKFVIYQFCISIIILTFRRNSNIYFIRSGENSLIKGLPFTFLSLLLGWWGIPWGPIYTIGAVLTNFQGGKDITKEVLATFQRPAT